MFSRVITTFLVACVLTLAGCCGCDSVGQPAPTFKFCTGARIVQEFAWLYADVQDVIFGVDYNQDIQDEFDTNPY